MFCTKYMVCGFLCKLFGFFTLLYKKDRLHYDIPPPTIHLPNPLFLTFFLPLSNPSFFPFSHMCFVLPKCFKNNVSHA